MPPSIMDEPWSAIEAPAILIIASLLNGECIPEEIFTQRPEGAANIRFPQTPEAYNKQLAELIQSSVFTRTIDGQLHMSKTVQDAVRAKMMDTPTLFPRTLGAAIRLVASVWPHVTVDAQPGYANYTKVDRWEQCEKLLPHILSLKDVVIDARISVLNLVPKVRREIFLTLLSEAAWYVARNLTFIHR